MLAAVDAAVMLLDAAKGLEPQTLKLFDVCRSRGIPVLTFVNKWDRPGREALELLDEVEQTIGLRPMPVTWPVGVAGSLRGLIECATGEFTRFTRTAGGATRAETEVVPAAEVAAAEPEFWPAAQDELALLREIGAVPEDGGFDEKDFRVLLTLEGQDHAAVGGAQDDLVARLGAKVVRIDPPRRAGEPAATGTP